MSIEVRPDLNAVTIVTDDLDELSEHAGVVLNPLGPSNRRGGSVVHIALDGITVIWGRVNQPVHTQSDVPRDVYRFGLKLDSPPGQWNGIPLDQRQMLVNGPGSDVEGSGGRGWATVTIPKVAFEDQLDRRQVPWEPPDVGRFSTVGHSGVEELGHQIDAVRRGLFSGDVAPGSMTTADRLIDTIVSTLSGAKSDLEISADSRSRWRSTEVVRMADALLTELGPITSVGELSTKLGISQRWLRDAFQLAVGISPKRYLTAHGMRGAHNDLVNGMTDKSSVSDIAHKWGFWHLSRFADVYRDYYGEHPSQTLQRATEVKS